MCLYWLKGFKSLSHQALLIAFKKLGQIRSFISIGKNCVSPIIIILIIIIFNRKYNFKHTLPFGCPQNTLNICVRMDTVRSEVTP